MAVERGDSHGRWPRPASSSAGRAPTASCGWRAIAATTIRCPCRGGSSSPTRAPGSSRRSGRTAPPPGAGPDDAHYRKLADLDPDAAPEMGARGHARDVDSQIALLRRSGSVSRRVKLYPIAVVDRFAASAFYPVQPTGRSASRRSPSPGLAEIRVHHVTAPGAPRVRDGGFAVAGDAPPEARTGPRWARHGARRRADLAHRRAPRLRGSGVQASEGTILGRHSATPDLTSEPMPAAEAVFVSLLAALAGGAIAADGPSPPSPRFRSGPAGVDRLSRRRALLRPDGGNRAHRPRTGPRAPAWSRPLRARLARWDELHPLRLTTPRVGATLSPDGVSIAHPLTPRSLRAKVRRWRIATTAG